MGSRLPRDQRLHRALPSRVHDHEEAAAYPHALGTVHAVANEGGDGPIDCRTSLPDDIPVDEIEEGAKSTPPIQFRDSLTYIPTLAQGLASVAIPAVE